MLNIVGVLQGTGDTLSSPMGNDRAPFITSRPWTLVCQRKKIGAK